MMKSCVMMTSAVAALLLVAGVPSKAADDVLLRRLEAKIDALSKENASLRDRVKTIEVTRAPVRVAALGTSVSDASPPAGAARQGHGARAADYPVKSPPPIRVGCARFAGWNVGANIGGAQQTTTWNDLDNWIDNFGTDFNTSSVTKSRTGVTIGASGGYNWQTNCTVYGFEVDGSWTSINGTLTASAAPGGTTLEMRDRLNFWGTARTKAGVVVDNLLLYATGGFAFANIKHDWTVTDAGAAPESFSARRWRWGGVAGVGAEWAVTPQWSVRSEVLYVVFSEDRSSGFSTAGNQTVHFNTNDNIIASRIAAIYKFGAK